MKNLKTDKADILLVGIGNSGRRDDGLGWKFTEIASRLGVPKIDCEFRYQLQVEDVLLICKYGKIIFADASHSKLPGGYEIKPCTPAHHYFFSSHMQTPETILYLAKELYNKNLEAYTIAIEGQNWGLGKALSKEAESNLQKAFSFFKNEFIPDAPANA